MTGYSSTDHLPDERCWWPWWGWHCPSSVSGGALRGPEGCCASAAPETLGANAVSTWSIMKEDQRLSPCERSTLCWDELHRMLLSLQHYLKVLFFRRICHVTIFTIIFWTEKEATLDLHAKRLQFYYMGNSLSVCFKSYNFIIIILLIHWFKKGPF